MDPVSIMVGAVAAGGVKGLTEAAAAAVSDTYALFKSLLKAHNQVT
jgi:hypothetical protein